MSDHTIVIIWVVKIFFVQFFCVFLPPLQSTKTRPGADCGPDHGLLIAKFRVKLKKVGKTTRPFMYDLDQIPYDYLVEVTHRIMELDLLRQFLKNYGRRFIAQRL